VPGRNSEVRGTDYITAQISGENWYEALRGIDKLKIRPAFAVVSFFFFLREDSCLNWCMFSFS